MISNSHIISAHARSSLSATSLLGKSLIVKDGLMTPVLLFDKLASGEIAGFSRKWSKCLPTPVFSCGPYTLFTKSATSAEWQISSCARQSAHIWAFPQSNIHASCLNSGARLRFSCTSCHPCSLTHTNTSPILVLRRMRSQIRYGHAGWKSRLIQCIFYSFIPRWACR